MKYNAISFLLICSRRIHFYRNRFLFSPQINLSALHCEKKLLSIDVAKNIEDVGGERR